MPTWLLIALGVGVGYLVMKAGSKTNIANLSSTTIETYAKAVEAIFKDAGLTNFTVGADTTYGFCLYDSRLLSSTVTSSAAACSKDWNTFLDSAAAYVAKGTTKASSDTYSPTSLAGQLTNLKGS